jgi:Fe2+ transport system protein B
VPRPQDCSEDGLKVCDVVKKVKPAVRGNGIPPEMMEFEKQVIEALKDDPRILEIEILERKRKLEDADSEKSYAREMELRRLESEERLAFERARYEAERAKADMVRSKADQAMAATQLRMMEFFASQMV